MINSIGCFLRKSTENLQLLEHLKTQRLSLVNKSLRMFKSEASFASVNLISRQEKPFLSRKGYLAFRMPPNDSYKQSIYMKMRQLLSRTFPNYFMPLKKFRTRLRNLSLQRVCRFQNRNYKT